DDLHLVLHCLDNLYGIRSGLTPYIQSDRFFSVENVPACRLGETVFDPSDVTDADGRAVYISDDDVAEFTDRINSAERSHADIRVATDHISSRSLDVFALNGLLKLAYGDVVGV